MPGAVLRVMCVKFCKMAEPWLRVWFWRQEGRVMPLATLGWSRAALSRTLQPAKRP